MPSQEFSARRGSIWERTTFEGKSLPELRAEMDAAVVSELRHYDNVTWAPGSAGTISGKWVRPAAATGDLLYYIHGGGFTLGSSGIPLPFLMELSHRLRITCFFRRLPAGTGTHLPRCPPGCLCGLSGTAGFGLLPDRIVVCGESAGATLSLGIPTRQRPPASPCPRPSSPCPW